MVLVPWSSLHLPLELPDEWTPIRVFLAENFLSVWGEYNRLCASGKELRDWRVPVFIWWEQQKIQYSGIPRVGRRADSNVIEASYTILDYDLAERRLEYFQVSGSQLTHRSGEVFYGWRIRATPPAEAPPPGSERELPLPALPATHSEGEPPKLVPLSDTATDRAAAAMREVWLKAKRPDWKPVELIKATTVAYPPEKDARLRLASSTLYAAARRARQIDGRSN